MRRQFASPPRLDHGPTFAVHAQPHLVPHAPPKRVWVREQQQRWTPLLTLSVVAQPEHRPRLKPPALRVLASAAPLTASRFQVHRSFLVYPLALGQHSTSLRWPQPGLLKETMVLWAPARRREPPETAQVRAGLAADAGTAPQWSVEVEALGRRPP